jgi:hypothetical protein
MDGCALAQTCSTYSASMAAEVLDGETVRRWCGPALIGVA